MSRKAARVELSKEHVKFITYALHIYICEYEDEDTLEFTHEELKSIKKLHSRFAQHLKSFEDNL